MHVTAQELADLLQGKIEGDPEAKVHSPSRIEESGPGSITFLAHPKYEAFAYSSKASVILVSDEFSPKEELIPTMIRVPDVYASLQVLLEKFDYQEDSSGTVSETALIDPSAEIGPHVTIMDYVKIEAGAKIGAHSIIKSHSYIGRNVEIGQNAKIHEGVRVMRECKIGNFCTLHPNAVVGSDGFGFAQDEKGKFKKIPQIGNVVIEDYVDLGTGTVVDRATMGSTILRRGVKVDNLVQIGHNVEIGENTAIAGQAGIAGSTKIGKNCLIGGQVGFAGHLTIADNTMIAAQAGINSDSKKEGGRLIGSPAIDYGQFWRLFATYKNLPDMARTLRRLEKEMKTLKQKD